MKFKLLFICFFFLSSCGFKPMLAKDESHNTILDKIQVVSVEGEDELRYNRIITEQFGTSSHPEYQLKIRVSQNISSIGITKDGQSTRYKVEVKFDYDLIESATLANVDSGNLSLSSSYDVPQSEYANYISERSTRDNLIQELCNDLKSRLMLILSARGKI